MTIMHHSWTNRNACMYYCTVVRTVPLYSSSYCTTTSTSTSTTRTSRSGTGYSTSAGVVRSTGVLASAAASSSSSRGGARWCKTIYWLQLWYCWYCSYSTFFLPTNNGGADTIMARWAVLVAERRSENLFALLAFICFVLLSWGRGCYYSCLAQKKLGHHVFFEYFKQVVVVLIVS